MANQARIEYDPYHTQIFYNWRTDAEREWGQLTNSILTEQEVYQKSSLQSILPEVIARIDENYNRNKCEPLEIVFRGASFMPEIRQWHASNVAPVWHLFSAKCGANLLRGALLARFVLIMGINAQRHIDRSVSCEILNLLDIQPALKQSCDVGMPELVRMNLEIQRADDLGVWSSCPKNGRIINRTVFNHLKQTLEPAFGKRLSLTDNGMYEEKR